MAKDFRNITIHDWITPVMVASPLPVLPAPPNPTGPPAPPVNVDPYWAQVRVLLRGDNEKATVSAAGQSIERIAYWLNERGEKFVNNGGLTFCPAGYADVELTSTNNPGVVIGSGPFDPNCDLAAAAAWAGLIPYGATRTIRLTPVGPKSLKAGETRFAGSTRITPRAGVLPVCAVDLSLVTDPGPITVVPVPTVSVSAPTRVSVYFNYDTIDTLRHVPGENWVVAHRWLENGGPLSTEGYEWRVTVLSVTPGVVIFPTDGMEGNAFIEGALLHDAFGTWWPFFDAEGYGTSLACAINGPFFGSGGTVNQAVLMYEVRDVATRKTKLAIRVTMRAGPGA